MQEFLYWTTTYRQTATTKPFESFQSSRALLFLIHLATLKINCLLTTKQSEATEKKMNQQQTFSFILNRFQSSFGFRRVKTWKSKSENLLLLVEREKIEWNFQLKRFNTASRIINDVFINIDWSVLVKINFSFQNEKHVKRIETGPAHFLAR